MKEEIEQLKRDLKSHSQYTRWIANIRQELERIALELRDCEGVSGISFEEKTSVGNAYRSPRMLELISEEEDKLKELQSLKNKIHDLDIENKMKCLSEIEAKVIKAIYFDGLSFRYVAEQLNYSKRMIEYHNDKALEKIVKNGTRPID